MSSTDPRPSNSATRPGSKAERRQASQARVQQIQVRQKAIERRNRTIIIVAALVVLALVGSAGYLLYQGSQQTYLSTYEGSVPANANAQGGVPMGVQDGKITAGQATEGAKKVDIYLDFMCPACGALEKTAGADLEQLIQDGKATVYYHPLNFLDPASSGTQYSSRAGNAFLQVANDAPESAMAFMRAMFAQQPQENSPGLDATRIATIAKDSGVSQEVIDRFAAGNYTDWVTRTTSQWTRDGFASTPSIVIDGQRWSGNWNQPGVLKQAIEG